MTIHMLQAVRRTRFTQLGRATTEGSRDCYF